MFKKILVATDGSDHGRNATAIAGDLAGRYDAALVVAHVLTDKPVPEELRRMAEVEHLVKEEKQAEGSDLGRLSLKASPRASQMRLLAAISGKLLEQGVAMAKGKGAKDVSPLELSGEPAEALVEAVGQHGVDLVVIGSRGFGPLGRLMHGSVSSKVSQEVRCPCLVVK